jgi:uncharacterized protein HemX
MDNMNNMTPNEVPTPTPVPAPSSVPAAKEENGVGPIVGVIIILIVIILGGLYFWYKRAHAPAPTDSAAVTEAATDAEVSEIMTTSSSDDTASIEADLNNTNTDGLNSQLNAIE